MRGLEDNPEGVPNRKLGIITPPLGLIEEEPLQAEKEQLVSYNLKVRAESSATSEKYKIFVKRFEDGTPLEYLEVIKKLQEIWMQNGVNSTRDRSAMVLTLFCRESLV